MERDLMKRAFLQGLRAGQIGNAISAADWEPAFWPAYRKGYEQGCAERAATHV